DVGPRLDLHVVDRRVEMRQEPRRGRQRDVVAEDDPADHQRRREEDERLEHPLLRLLERRDEERPRLPEDDRQRDRGAEVERQPERRHERLADAEREQLAVLLRELVGQQADDAAVDHERGDPRDDDRADAHEEPLTQFLEMLDERGLLAVFQATRQTHRALVNGLVLAGRRGRRRVLRPHRELRAAVGLAADGVLELPHAGPERAADLRQPLGPEEQEGENQQADDLERTDVRHAAQRISVWAEFQPGNRDLMRKKPLSEQVVVVTGGSAGLGRAIARAAAARGASVVVASRGGDGLDATVAELGPRSHGVQADVASLDDCHRIVEEAVNRFGRIDTFCANAMVTVYREARELDPEELRRVLDVNFLGAVNCYWAALPRLVESRGTFSHVNSALAYRGIPLQAAYCSSKAAARTFFETARVEHQKH